MNPQRRARIKAQADEISNIIEDLELIRDEEQQAFDNLPDGIQDCEKGENMAEAVVEIDDQISELQECKTSLENFEH